jgi:hypothetical protein
MNSNSLIALDFFVLPYVTAGSTGLPSLIFFYMLQTLETIYIVSTLLVPNGLASSIPAIFLPLGMVSASL